MFVDCFWFSIFPLFLLPEYSFELAIAPVCQELTYFRLKQEVCTCFVALALLTDFLYWIFIVGGGGGLPAIGGIVLDPNNVLSLQTRVPNVRSDSVIHSNAQWAFEMARSCSTSRGRWRTTTTVSHFHILYQLLEICIGESLFAIGYKMWAALFSPWLSHVFDIT